LRSRLSLTYGLFLVSGATGLLYEVAFSKVLATIFGATAYAISTVLSAFMAGLALGAFLGGRIAHRLRRPLAGYGVAEIGVGLLALLTPFAFDALESAYVSLASSSLLVTTIVRGALTFGVILVPTTCMGATLPILSRTARSQGEGVLPQLYAINTLGGALGSLLSAYLVLPWLGIRGTMHATAVLNVSIGLVAIFAGRRELLHDHHDATVAVPTEPVATKAPETEAPAAGEEPPSPADSASLAPALLLFAFASGFLVFATEVVETHLLALLIGNSAYAFGLMLAVFLLCLGFGAARASWLVQQREGSPSLTTAGLPRGLGLSALLLALTIPLWDQLPHFFSFAGKLTDDWTARELCRGLAAFAILVLPTIFMGTSFPVLLSAVARRRTVARDVAKLTIANTSGTILGSIVTGYVVLPLLGSQRSLQAIALVFGVLGLAALSPKVLGRGAPEAPVAEQPGRRRTLGLTAVAMLVTLVLPPWDLARLTNGANVYFTHGPPPDDILFVREDVHGGVTTVVRRGEIVTMYTNGKFQGDDGPEMAAQRHFAHFPALFLPREERALVIGLGTGVTLGTVAAYPFERIDLAEISPAIVDAARTFYAGPARHSLDDPRVSLHLNDGRNVLLLEQGQFDLITIELTSVWFAGASNLYSVEFYELCKSRLSEGGVLQQWVQLHHIRPRELATIVRTLRRSFAHVALFEGGSQGILVASQTPLVASRARLDRLGSRAEVTDTLDGAKLESLLNELLLSDAELDALVADIAASEGGPILSTDDNLFLEYATPKGNVLEYKRSLEDTLALLERYRTPNVRARHLAD
jgi:spermidine synthase